MRRESEKYSIFHLTVYTRALISTYNSCYIDFMQFKVRVKKKKKKKFIIMHTTKAIRIENSCVYLFLLILF